MNYLYVKNDKKSRVQENFVIVVTPVLFSIDVENVETTQQLVLAIF